MEVPNYSKIAILDTFDDESKKKCQKTSYQTFVEKKQILKKVLHLTYMYTEQNF